MFPFIALIALLVVVAVSLEAFLGYWIGIPAGVSAWKLAVGLAPGALLAVFLTLFPSLCNRSVGFRTILSLIAIPVLAFLLIVDAPLAEKWRRLAILFPLAAIPPLQLLAHVWERDD